MAKITKTRKYKKLVGQADKLRSKKKMSQYKTLDKYLDAVYANNQEYLNKHIETFGDTKKKRGIFKEEVKILMDQINPETGKKYTVKQAIDYVQRSTTVRTRDQRGFEVVMSRMKEESPEAYKKMRMAAGWKNKISSEYVKYIGSNGKNMEYEYYDPNTGKHFKMIVRISPGKDGMQDIQIQELDMQKIQDEAAKSFEDILRQAGKRKGQF